MKTVARITGIILMVASVLMILSAFVVAIGGSIGAREVIARMGAPRLMAGASLLAGLFILGQGLLTAAIGQGLYLLAEIAQNSAAAQIKPNE